MAESQVIVCQSISGVEMLAEVTWKDKKYYLENGRLGRKIIERI